MTRVTIETPEPGEGRLPLARDVRVFADGVEIKGIRAMDVQYRMDNVVRAQIELCPVWHGGVEGSAEFFTIHPETGEPTQIEYIQFADGTRFQC